jgi:UDP-2,3-diacylglucosamine pyrophosphatase LpxH
MTTLYVISDLHLGGGDGFQMCTGQAALARFLEARVEEARASGDVELVINGDAVDFLAEAPFRALTVDDGEATRKLNAILGRAENQGVFGALRAFVAAGGRLTVLLGNHDLELRLPGPRAALQAALGEGAVLQLDGSPLRRGGLWIDHGNVVDPWNCVNHRLLGRLAADIAGGDDSWSVLEEGELRDALKVPPGSQLVVDVMNKVKARYRFVDLLKPETEAVLPLLAALEPELSPHLRRAAGLARGVGLRMVLRSLWGAAGGGDLSEISDAGGPAAAFATAAAQEIGRKEAAIRDAARVEAGVEDEISASEAARSWWQVWQARRAGEDREAQLGRLRRALSVWHEAQQAAYDTTREGELWLKGAQAAFEQGAALVVYGHTHFARDVAVGSGRRYLNTGTWADLMTVPDAIFGADEAAAGRAMARFADDLAGNELTAWRSSAPCYARVALDGQGEPAEAGVYLVDPDSGAAQALSTGAIRGALTRNHPDFTRS